MTDPIADMITRIKNALMAGHSQVLVPHSKMKKAVADILLSQNFVSRVEVEETKPQAQIKIDLRYVGKIPAITGVKRISKPGRRVYSSSKQLPKTLGGYGVTIVSTSQGVLTDTAARQRKVGGEVICQIW